MEPAVPVFAPALPVEPTEPFVLALVLPVAPRELAVEPVVDVPPMVLVEVVPVGAPGVVVVVVDPELLGRDPVVLLCPGLMLFGVVVELAPELVDVLDCPAVLPGVVADVIPTAPAVLPG